MSEVLHNRGNLPFNQSIQDCEVHQYEPQLRAPCASSIAEILIDIEVQVFSSIRLNLVEGRLQNNDGTAYHDADLESLLNKV